MSEGFFDDIAGAMDQKRKTQQEDAESPKFDPEVGDLLQAVLLGAKPFTGGRFHPTVVIVFRNVGDTAIGGVEPGKSGSMFAGTVMRTKLFDAQPAIGTPFALTFEGVPEGKSYNDWTLYTAYEATGNQSDLDTVLWAGIQRTIAEHTPAQQQRTAQATSGPTSQEWKF